jgi:hypothetical protein
MTDNAGVTHRKVDDIFILELPAPGRAAGAEANRWVEWGLADSPGVVIVDFARTTEADAAGVEASVPLRPRRRGGYRGGFAALGANLKPQMEAAGYLKRAKAFDTVDDAIAEM